MSDACGKQRGVPAQPEGTPPGRLISINCPKCRTPLGKQIKFCTSCGAKVDEVPSVDRPRQG